MSPNIILQTKLIMNKLNKYGLFILTKNTNKLLFNSYKDFNTSSQGNNLNQFRKDMRQTLLNKNVIPEKNQNLVGIESHNIKDKQNKSYSHEAFQSELQPQKDLSLNIRAKGIFERDPSDKSTS